MSETAILQSRSELIEAMTIHLPMLTGTTDRIWADDKEHLLSRSHDNPLQVSYAAKPDHRYDSSKRARTSLGRYLSRNYGVLITPAIDAAIAELFASLAYNEESFEVREDVCEVYRTVAESCMSGEPCVEFYERNGVKVLVYTPPGKDEPLGRALLWQTDQGGFVDRVYPNSGPHVAHYVKWAEEHGYDIRSHHRAGYNGGDRLRVRGLSVGPMPYMDTFAYLEGDTLSTSGPGLICCETDGSEPTTCGNCDDWCFGGGGEGYCQSCLNSRNYCNRCDDYTFDEVICIDGRYCCESCLEDAETCDRCHDQTFETRDVDGQSVCGSCVRNHCTCDSCDCLSLDLTRVDGSDLCDTCCQDAEEEETIEAVPAVAPMDDYASLMPFYSDLALLPNPYASVPRPIGNR